MAATQFLIRNRHCNVWYGRIVIPQKLREHFNGKRELRKSLGTSDRKLAKRLALEFWIACQNGFDRLDDTPESSFTSTAQFVSWMTEDGAGKEMLLHMPPHKKIDKFLKGQAQSTDSAPRARSRSGGIHTDPARFIVRRVKMRRQQQPRPRKGPTYYRILKLP